MIIDVCSPFPESIGHGGTYWISSWLWARNQAAGMNWSDWNRLEPGRYLGGMAAGWIQTSKNVRKVASSAALPSRCAKSAHPFRLVFQRGGTKTGHKEKCARPGYVNIAIENCHWNSGFSQLENGGSFHSYVNVYQAGYTKKPAHQDAGRVWSSQLFFFPKPKTPQNGRERSPGVSRFPNLISWKHNLTLDNSWFISSTLLHLKKRTWNNPLQYS